MNWRQLDGFSLYDDESEIESWIRISSKYFDYKDAGIAFMKYGLNMDNVRDIIHAYFGLQPFKSSDLTDFSNLEISDNETKPLTLDEIQKKYSLTKGQFNDVIDGVIKNLEGFLEEPDKGIVWFEGSERLFHHDESVRGIAKNFLEVIKRKRNN